MDNLGVNALSYSGEQFPLLTLESAMTKFPAVEVQEFLIDEELTILLAHPMVLVFCISICGAEDCDIASMLWSPIFPPTSLTKSSHNPQLLV